MVRPRSLVSHFALTNAGLLVALLTGTASCSKHDGATTTDAAPTMSAEPAAVDAAVVLAEAGADAAPAGENDELARRGGFHRGPAGMLFQAVRALTLTPEQQTKVDAADKMTAAPADPAVHEAAAKDLHNELITGIKAGKIDTSKLDAKYTAIEHLATAEHDKEADSLTALHDALDPGQRKVVTTSVRAKIAKRDEKLATRGDAGAPLLPDGGKPPSAGKRSLERLTRGLDLDADQQKKIDAIPTKDEPKVDPAEQKKRVDALLDAFEKDKFDAKKADGFDTKKLRAGLEDETKLLTQILPILKPEQRDKLAAKMERGPSPHGGRRPGFAGRRPLTESEDDDFAN